MSGGGDSRKAMTAREMAGLSHEERLAAAEAEVARLTEVCNESNAECACGCPPSEHEGLGEDGESCGHDDHECVRTSHAVAMMLAVLRAEVARLREALRRVSEWGCDGYDPDGPAIPISGCKCQACIARAALSGDAPAQEVGRE